MDLVDKKAEIGSKKYGKEFLEEMKNKFGIDLIGVMAVDDCDNRFFKRGIKALLPRAKSAVVFAVEVAKETLALVYHPSKYLGRPATGEVLEPHFVWVTNKLENANNEVASILRKDGYPSIALPSRGLPMEMGRGMAMIDYVHVALEAGMGTIGHHGFLITPEFGPRVRLGVLLTEAPIEPTVKDEEKDFCIHCYGCVDVCPVKAIKHPDETGKLYEVDAMRCKFFRNRTEQIEMGTCGLCMKVCDVATSEGEEEAKKVVAGRR
jgi:epoxyqueuosine reductase QueG